MKTMNLKLQKIADQVRDVIAKSFCGGRVQDPRLQNITITHVKLSADLFHANVYFLGDKSKMKEIDAGFKSVHGFLRKQIAENIKIRCVPSLQFFYDESVDEGSHIEKLISQMNN